MNSTQHHGVHRHDPWAPPGWPWELELLSLMIVAIAIFLPFTLPAHYRVILEIPEGHQGFRQVFEIWNTGYGYVWMLLIAGIYFMHWVSNYLVIEYITTPFSQLFAPLLFAALAYGRLYTFYRNLPPATRLISGTPLEAITWFAVVMLASLLIARYRTIKHLRQFKNTHWDVSLPPASSRGQWLRLIWRVHPLFYRPRCYHAGSHGLLIEGWTYLLPIHYSGIEAFTPIVHDSPTMSGFFTATSAHNLIRIQLFNRPVPIFISPQHPNLLWRYCQQLMHGGQNKHRHHKPRNTTAAPRHQLIPPPDTTASHISPYYNI
jgi:hypothetical protein